MYFRPRMWNCNPKDGEIDDDDDDTNKSNPVFVLKIVNADKERAIFNLIIR